MSGVSLTNSSLVVQSLSQASANQGIKDLKAKPSDKSKIEKSAHDFESILIGQWLDQAEKSFATVPGTDPDQTDPGHDQLQGIATQSLAQAMSKSGGLGIAAMIAKGLEKNLDKANSAVDAAKTPVAPPVAGK
ncbi:MAG TPA: rod-binding protein [Terriglobales bacterium]|jgi:Rod binding domain-containing protein